MGARAAHLRRPDQDLSEVQGLEGSPPDLGHELRTEGWRLVLGPLCVVRVEEEERVGRGRGLQRRRVVVLGLRVVLLFAVRIRVEVRVEVGIEAETEAEIQRFVGRLTMPSPPPTTVVVDGLALAQEIRAEIAAEIDALVARGQRPPCLAVVLVGEDPASASYIRGKRRASERCGMTSVEHRRPTDAHESELLDLLGKLNGDDGIDGILVQLPLPKQIRAEVVAAAVDPAKDVDGLSPVSGGRLLAGLPGLYPCTPLGILEVLDRQHVPLVGANAVVIGRSQIVGKPVSLLLLQRHATVTICHSRTRNLADVVRGADVVVAAVGSARLVKRDWIRPGAAVIDVGVNEIDGRLVGDVDFEGLQGVASLITPPKGGVGPLTITFLLRNTLDAFRARVLGEPLRQSGAPRR